jgi:hypothetical protein
LFHFGQSLHKKLKKLQLSELYQHNQQFHKWIRLIFALALVPESEVMNCWQNILDQKPSIVNDDVNFNNEPQTPKASRGRLTTTTRRVTTYSLAEPLVTSNGNLLVIGRGRD